MPPGDDAGSAGHRAHPIRALGSHAAVAAGTGPSSPGAALERRRSASRFPAAGKGGGGHQRVRVAGRQGDAVRRALPRHRHLVLLMIHKQGHFRGFLKPGRF